MSDDDQGVQSPPKRIADFYANLGKYTSPMDGMGIVSGCFIGIPSEVSF